MESETLFSLEVVVEEVCVLSSATPCRLPAIAFRLLDFPTLVIHHIETDMAQTIKTKLSMDPTIEVPPQLSELKDRWGIFNVNKGKSCLFKIDVDTLSAHLDNTPLYMMLIDMWPSIPKLVGNSTIPLNTTMKKICSDIEKVGINVPSVQGEKGRYKLYNLMSSEIGYITMGYRLLSLGPGLMQHIPDKAIMRAGVTAKRAASPEAEKVKAAADIVLEDIQTPMQRTALVISKVDEQSQIKAEVKPVMTQTEKRTKIPRRVQFIPDDEFHVADMICPPPLYFNSQAEEADEVTKVHPLKDVTSTPLWYDGDDISDTESVVSDISGIAVIESHYKYKETQTPPVSSVRKTRHAWGEKKKPLRQTSMPRQPVQPQAVAPETLPLLNALMQEISRLQVVQSSAQEVSPVKPAPIGFVRPPTRGKENVKSRIKLATPKQPPRERHKHKKCAQLPGRVPPHVGWLRQEPLYGMKKTKLMYGMTNTQRLRLQKNNPELFKHLEEREVRQNEWYSDAGDSSVNKPTIADNNLPLGKTRTLHLEQPQSPKRKPVPTPRMSVEMIAEKKETTGVQSERVEHIDLKELVAVGKEIERSQSGSSSNRSTKSIEVHIPSVSVDASDQLTDVSSVVSEQSDDEFRPNQPGFPHDSDNDEHGDVKDNQSERYSEDFEESQEEISGSERSHELLSSSQRSSSASYHSQRSSTSERSVGSSRSESDLSDIGTGYQPSVPMPSLSAKSPVRMPKTIAKGIATYQPVTSTPTTEENKKDSHLDSSEYRTVSSYSELKLSDDAF
ncbi:microtubule-associated protein 10-like [Saccoglossus kowalevskii]|uniref:Microtubule-associated protein 10-like n=1 Tax=Saccoglossus kowalevskii TaxID=10224 RepID=A0ABM0LWS6_SACKO|nr:PREDICTED: microtubule-associated protein 10-like [Saccoglossus kowalevskii]